MTDTVPSWHDPTGRPTTGTGWSPQGQARPQTPPPGAAGRGTSLEQLEQRVFDELGRTQTAIAQVHAEAQAARDDAQAARVEARDAHEAAEVLLDQVSAWEDAASGTATGDPAQAAPVPDDREHQPVADPAGSSPAPGRQSAEGTQAGHGDPVAGALAEFAAALQAAADARARGEIDARHALRLARSSFHSAHRVISRAGREELRAGR